MAEKLDPKELVIRDALITELRRIGTQGGQAFWWTRPGVYDGDDVQGEARYQKELPAIFVDIEEVEELEVGTGAADHLKKATFVLWLVVQHQEQPTRELHRLARDVERAIYTGEGALQALAEGGVWNTALTRRFDASDGYAVAEKRVRADYYDAHD